MAQLKPKDVARFRSVTVEEARLLLLQSLEKVKEENIIRE
jgi:hypothetical protein